MTKKKEEGSKDFEHNNEGSGNGRDMEEMAGSGKSGKRVPEDTPAKEIKEELRAEELEEEVELQREELESYKKIEEEYVDRIKRLQADYDNYRKRTLKEHLEHIKRANKDLIEKLLPIIDSFEIAIDTGKKLKRGGDDFIKGMEMIYNKLMELLKKENVKIIDPKGQEFDPRLCEAAVTEAVEGVEEGSILEVIKKGYMIDDFLIRPAVVKVCKKR